MSIIGIDPGKTGAIAKLTITGGLLSVHDMPSDGTKHVSVGLLYGVFKELVTEWPDQPPICVIEDVSSSPQMGVTSAFSFGRSKGVVEAMAAGFGMRLVYVTPSKWKKDMRLGKDKGEARRAAIDRWPQFAQDFKLVKNDGRAEAALIGLWQIQHGPM